MIQSLVDKFRDYSSKHSFTVETASSSNTDSSLFNSPQIPTTPMSTSQKEASTSTSTPDTPNYNNNIIPSNISAIILLGVSSGLTYAIVQHCIASYITNNDDSSNKKENKTKSFPSPSSLFLQYLPPPPSIRRMTSVFHTVWNNVKKGEKTRLLWNVIQSSINNIWHSTSSLFLEEDDGEEEDRGDMEEDEFLERIEKEEEVTESSSSTIPITTSTPPKLIQKQRHPKEDNTRRSRSNSVLTQTSETSISVSTTANTAVATQKETRYFEMLVHNVSHMDMVLSLGLPTKLISDGGTSSTSSMDDGKSAVTPRIENKFKCTSTPTTTTANSPSKSSTTHKQEEFAHVLFRPRFSAFDMFSRRVLAILRKCHTERELHTLVSAIMSFPRYERADSVPRFPIVTPRPSRQMMLPVGFNLSQLLKEDDDNEGEEGKGSDDMDDGSYISSSGGGVNKLNLEAEDIQSMRIRGRDMAKVESLVECGYFPSPLKSTMPHTPRDQNQTSTHATRSPPTSTTTSLIKKLPIHIDAIFFPLLSSLLRRWKCQMSDKYGSIKNKIKKVVILVTGVGTPRNWTHSITGNSTEACAELMEIFMNVLYPDITVVRLHSEREIFRYDENITFSNKELMPCIDAYRDAHACGERYPDEFLEKGWANKGIPTCKTSKVFDPDWKQTFSVTLSFADGAPARTHAIQTSLRPYRPTYMHFFQLKTFWHESKICDDDIEVHSFEEMETVPAMEVIKTNNNVQMVVDEMKKFRQFFLTSLNEGRNDIRNFWLRKTKKPVLAVLLVDRPGEGLVMYRGANMEVSMPTGSLCAERNVIGTALATNPGLLREHLKMVAVLAVPLEQNDEQPDITTPSFSPSPPPGVNPNICTTITGEADTRGKSKGETKAEVFFSEVEEKLSQYQRPENIRRSMSVGSFASIVERDSSNQSDDDGSWVMETSTADNKVPLSVTGSLQAKRNDNDEVVIVPPLNFSNINRQGDNSIMNVQHADGSSDNSTPLRKVQLHSDNDELNSVKVTKDIKKSVSGSSCGYRRKKKKTVLVHSSEDINPLKPCGACNEWLKKIAESNPHFKVVTFTDADCNGVYVTPCQE